MMMADLWPIVRLADCQDCHQHHDLKLGLKISEYLDYFGSDSANFYNCDHHRQAGRHYEKFVWLTLYHGYNGGKHDASV